MDNNNIPLIYLLNTQLDSEKELKAAGFNALRYKLNGYVSPEQSYYPKSISYAYVIPENIHEAEIIVIDTSLNEFSYGEKISSSVSLCFKYTPSYVGLLPIDISIIDNQIFSTNKNQAIIIFCDSNTDTFYTIKNNSGSKNNSFRYSTYNFNNSDLGVIDRKGNRFKKPHNVIEKDLTDLIFKYSHNSNYSVTFNKPHENDIILAENEAGNTISFIRKIKEKTFIFLPAIYNKTEFLNELFCNILPDMP